MIKQIYKPLPFLQNRLEITLTIFSLRYTK